MQEQDTNGCREIPKRRWVFVHGNDPIVIDEQEVRGSCFFRDYVMGKLECRRLDPDATAIEFNPTIDPGKLIIVKKATYRLNLSERQRNFIRAHTQRGLK